MFLNLEFEMKRKGYTTEKLAKLLNKSRKAITNRLSGKVEFDRFEMFQIRNLLFPDKTIDYLFEINNTI